jgi:hypothetical protein
MENSPSGTTTHTLSFDLSNKDVTLDLMIRVLLSLIKTIEKIV